MEPKTPYSALGGKVCVVTGSQGMFGLSLCNALLTAAGAAEVRGFDRVTPKKTMGVSAARGRSRSPSRSPPAPGGRRRSSVDRFESSGLPLEYRGRLQHFCGDITSSSQLRAACRGADVVFHAASYGMSGDEMLDRTQTRAVNISGTKHVIDCCRSEKVECLVYTSTYNTVFGGQRVDNGDEAMDYYPVHEHADEYSRTKALAEQLVLAAGKAVGSDALRTVALRSAAIYGEGERRHFPRIIQVAQGLPWCSCIRTQSSSHSDLPSCLIRQCVVGCTYSPSANHPTFAIGFMWTTSCMLICWLRLHCCKLR
jgi:nucleoside-diphosphate-sugar epimerase